GSAVAVHRLRQQAQLLLVLLGEDLGGVLAGQRPHLAEPPDGGGGRRLRDRRRRPLDPRLGRRPLRLALTGGGERAGGERLELVELVAGLADPYRRRRRQPVV